MSKYASEARDLLEYIGGKENIGAVTHCATRLRFVLQDTALANKEKIESINIVKGVFSQAGQFQVIIGNDVSVFYNEFVELSGVNSVSKEEAKHVAKNNMSFIQKLMANLAEIFAPIIPALIVGGLVLGFRNIIGDVKIFDDGTKALVEMSQFWAGLHSFLWIIGEAIFHFLPVGIVWAVTKKMGTSQILGIVLGITLVSPQLLNAYAVAGGGEIPVWDFGFTKIDMIGYQGQVIPAILAGFVLVYLERGLRKICPSSISMIIVPFFSLIPSVLLAHTILGPIGWSIGEWISSVVYSGLTSIFGWLFAAIFGFAYAPLVITGLHHMTTAIDLQLIAELDGTSLWPMIALSNIAQGSAVLAMLFLQKRDEAAKQVNVPACISAYLGVTEPALFGVNIKYMFPFLAGMIGSSVAAIISVSNNVMANSIGVGGLPGILSIQTSSMGAFAIAMVVAIVIPFVVTIILGKRKLLSYQSVQK